MIRASAASYLTEYRVHARAQSLRLTARAESVLSNRRLDSQLVPMAEIVGFYFCTHSCSLLLYHEHLAIFATTPALHGSPLAAAAAGADTEEMPVLTAVCMTLS